MGVTEQLARFALETRPIPDDVRELATNHLVDGIAVMLAGAAEESGRLVRAHLREIAGAAQATVLGSRLRAPLQLAAWANGTAGHAMDYDDTQLATDPQSVYGLLTHPTVPVLAAALAAAEGAGASGAALLDAYIVGVEVACRIADAVHPRHYRDGFHSTATMGGFGAAAAAARIFGCDLDATLRAFGLAASMSAGLRENFGTMTKPFHAGRAAENGLFAVLLARRGWTAAKNILEAPRGFYSAAAGGYDPARIEGKLGAPYFFIHPGISIKPYPSGSLSHPAQDVLLDLVREHDIRPEQVERIDVGVNSHVPNALIHTRPTTALEGKFSLQFQMAIGVLERRAGIAQFVDAKVQDPRTRALMERVHVYVDPEIEALGYNEMRMKVRITLRDGRTLAGYADKAKGHPRKPMTRDDLREKFLDCATLVMPTETAESALVHLWAIREIERVADLMPMLTGTAP
ncbi:MAG: MmgE/PrpD family protein [Armatimonadota bacterium]|nr:MmgE/PrpD family protein [Armatimonadota bacterium]MDR7452139.1 MmgE/PrpD family protein [Armatimonadota bacterium]MDR7467863.1 MmgE/PrpD family protein [Armatimonadota bacterium]MDR7494751.1 MmgE/PrpD family protein [Armatimonadota bacterium]MDR7499576.1 MmgE/PrpD family protein [Armatimonadota bacterium]